MLVLVEDKVAARATSAGAGQHEAARAACRGDPQIVFTCLERLSEVDAVLGPETVRDDLDDEVRGHGVQGRKDRTGHDRQDFLRGGLGGLLEDALDGRSRSSDAAQRTEFREAEGDGCGRLGSGNLAGQ
ncbi:hypothetical protein H340_10800 [Streptomyces mobaraensis NBRC 13819 = DSM 40847]|uniref:Uncharacterized protein n=1 Tax=Streptomyces mobaraensis (strain ATCC 29032 / DSM 40847 / JCM 4168 / NBRC 13819 / NCIMB 11159 / IPCR 16-22) TaxID=1223523 RepID=M3B3I9_STRM1|nr:hypothetical protein H340_10800 [Streptomyces mobaraensis NBRC 13819 = DSM 40847]